MTKVQAAAAAAIVLAIGACDDDDPIEAGEQFVAEMTVEAEVPPVAVETDASGTARFEFDDDDDEITYTLDVANITGVTAAHIHGPATTSESAGVIVGLFVGPQGGTGSLNGQLVAGSFTETDNANVSMDSLLVLMRNGRSYVNVHTNANPPGEIRGQIQPD